MWRVSLLLALSLAIAAPIDDELASEPVRVQIDWQAHPAMHIPWFMFGKGLTDRPLKRRTWRHQFRQTVTEQTLGDSGVRIFLAAAMAAERAKNPKQAKRLILEQLAYVEDFVARHPESYVLAKTPAQARTALRDTDKMVVVHSIEGMHELLWQPTDAQFWADQGVALATLIHLRDEELGGSAILDQAVGPLINPKGAKKRRKDLPRGLSEMGKSAIVQLDEAGILVDYTHVSPEALEDALEVCEANGIPPILTHSVLAKARDDEFGISDEQLVQVYKLGGFFASGLNAQELTGGETKAQLPERLCPGTVEAWTWHHGLVQQTLQDHVAEIFEDSALTTESMTEAQRTALSTGWSSDWNGWTSHSTPVARCRDVDDPTDLDRKGLAHPGMLPAHWEAVEAQGVDLDPMLRSAERFLQLWESVREER
ncbi:MAG: membrane dipeptidase [Proteobacteria bacterium]|nr:membrane dipeptidase [Pseudomonadota bacterium]